MKYHVMEYLASPGKSPVIGYVFLEDKFYKKWSKNPLTVEVKGYAIVIGMESCAEWGLVHASRMWDYGRITEKFPEDFTDINEWIDSNCTPG